MHWFAVVFIVFVMASTAAAQVNEAAVGAGVTGIAVPVSHIARIAYSFNNSVIDHTGRLLKFEVTYKYAAVPMGQPVGMRYPPTAMTHVTVIDSDGITKHDAGQFNGTFQVVGVGRHAVYAIVNDYSSATLQAPTSIMRSLFAFGPSFPPSNPSTPVPSIALPWQSEVKVSAVRDDVAVPDTIVVVNNVITPPILAPPGTMAPGVSIPVRHRTAQMFQSD